MIRRRYARAMGAPGRGWAIALLVAWLAGASRPAAGPLVEAVYTAGLRVQDEVDFRPGGNWRAGPELGLSDYALFRHALQFQAAYLTNRVRQPWHRYLVPEDHFLLGLAWHFRRPSLLDPYLQAEGGYARRDAVNDSLFGDLDHQTWLVNASAGLALNFGGGAWGLDARLGWSFRTLDQDLPGLFGFSAWMGF